MDIDLVITNDGSPTLYVERFDEHYHSIHGSIQESLHVFIQAGLDYKAKQQPSIRIFEMGLGTGLNALLTLNYAQQHNVFVDYHAIELYPLTLESINKLAQFPNFNHPNFLELHQIKSNEMLNIGENFRFIKYLQDINDYKPSQLFDLIYYDAFAPSAQDELWTVEMFQKMYDMLDDGGCLVTYCAKGIVKRTLKSVGFNIESLPGPIGKREMTRAIKL
ncbi:MAG: tRNA (5-methylaminomethyl-2-thiouridine)(34)-methyltransferase MnmD [Chitinophagales bacterium]